MGKRSLPTSRGLTQIALGAALAIPAVAQDSQYWSIQYGPVGQLVGGQLIGGAPDLSATYYNPGALALKSRPSFLLSTQAVQTEYFSTASPAALGGIFDAESSIFGAAPSLLAGKIPKWLGQNTELAWSFLTRQKLEVRLGQRTFGVIRDWEKSVGESYLNQRTNEIWGGITVSHRLSEASGLGVTVYGVNRGQRSRKEVTVQAIAGDGRSLAVSGVTDFEYSHNRALAKLGYSWQTPTLNVGLSVTTPSLAVFGRGKAGYTLFTAGIDAEGDGRVDLPTLSTEAAKKLDSNYRSSWAIGVGGAKRHGSTRIYASAEWFAPVGAFNLLALPERSARPGLLAEKLKDVLNAGIAIEHIRSEDVSFYGAFHTDFSAATEKTEESVAVSDLNLYHFSGGASFKIQGNRFTLGALLATGSKTRIPTSPLPPGSLPGYGLDREIDLHYTRITLLLGFEVGKE